MTTTPAPQETFVPIALINPPASGDGYVYLPVQASDLHEAVVYLTPIYQRYTSDGSLSSPISTGTSGPVASDPVASDRTSGAVPSLPELEDDLSGSPADPGSGSWLTRQGRDGVVWPPSGYQALAEWTGKTTRDRIIAIGNALCEADGLLRMTELAEVSGVSTTEIPQALGKLSEYISRHMNTFDNKWRWPFGWEFGRDVDAEHPREFHYYMTPAQRAAWREANAA